MKILKVESNKHKKDFFQIYDQIYNDNKFYYNSNKFFNFLLSDKKTHYDKKLLKTNFIIIEDLNNDTKHFTTIGRFTIFIDRKMPKTIFVGFFEFAFDNINPIPTIIKYFKNLYGKNKRVIFGINGSFFYGGGFFSHNQSKDDYISFGNSFTKSYYNNFFDSCEKIKLYTYNLHITKIHKLFTDFDLIFKKKNIKFHSFSKGKFSKQINIVTAITNNAYKSSLLNRTVAFEWDISFFSRLKPLIPTENIVIIEQNGKYVGALVFLYDINEILTIKQDITRFTFAKYNKTKQWRKAKIIRFAVSKHCSNPFLIMDGLLLKAFSIMREKNVEFCQIGPFLESDTIYNQAIQSYLNKFNRVEDNSNNIYNVYECNL